MVTPRRMLERWAGCVVLLLAGLSFAPVHGADAVLGVAAAKTLPIIDAHFHVLQWMNGATLLEEMDRHGVRMTGGVGGGNLQAIMALGRRFIRPTGMGAWLGLHRRLDAASSHCGSTATAADMRRMFETHPNVSCDLSARGAPFVLGRTQIFDERQLHRDWRTLIEDYPDRFVVGIDTVHDWQTYDNALRAIRLGLLANLSPETAEKVAFRNAEVWFGLR